jgi:cysteinyl-tRNA synthetase
MSRSIDNIVLLESNVNKLKSLIVKLKTENSKIINELNLKDESLVKKSDELKDWKEIIKNGKYFLG